MLAAAPVGGVIVLGMTVIGTVSGAYYSPATTLLSDLFEQTGRAIGIHRIGAHVVGFTSPLVTFVSVTYGWRTVPLLSGLVALPVLGGFGLFVRSRPPLQSDRSLRKRLQPAQLTALLSRPKVAFTTAIAGFGQFAGYLGLLSRTRSAAVVGAIVLIGLGMGWSPSVQSRALDQLAETERGIGFGLIRTVYIAFAGLCGIVIGGAVTISGWASALVILAAVLVGPAIALGANAVFRLGL